MRQTVILVRHGAREDFSEEGFSSKHDMPRDVPLSKLGLMQAEELAEKFRDEDIRHFFVSPYIRALQTAAPIAHVLGLKMKVEDGIGECLWEALSPPPELMAIDERLKKFPLVDSGYDSIMKTIVGPEPGKLAQTRVGGVVRRLTEMFEGNLLIVGHGVTVLGGAKALIDGTEPISASFCSITRIERRDAGWSMTSNGDISHLSEAACRLQHTVTD